MKKLENYITGKWIPGEGEGQALYNAYNGSLIMYASTNGIDFAAALKYKTKKALARLETI